MLLELIDLFTVPRHSAAYRPAILTFMIRIFRWVGPKRALRFFLAKALVSFKF